MSQYYSDPKPFHADFWYRCSDDPDQSIRHGCQMSASMADRSELEEAIASLESQHYVVQRVDLQLLCPACQGYGRIGKAPKGTRKAKIASLPTWRLTWSECQDCQGKGYTTTERIRGE